MPCVRDERRVGVVEEVAQDVLGERRVDEQEDVSGDDEVKGGETRAQL